MFNTTIMLAPNTGFIIHIQLILNFNSSIWSHCTDSLVSVYFDKDVLDRLDMSARSQFYARKPIKHGPAVQFLLFTPEPGSYCLATHSVDSHWELCLGGGLTWWATAVFNQQKFSQSQTWPHQTKGSTTSGLTDICNVQKYNLTNQQAMLIRQMLCSNRCVAELYY